MEPCSSRMWMSWLDRWKDIFLSFFLSFFFTFLLWVGILWWERVRKLWAGRGLYIQIAVYRLYDPHRSIVAWVAFVAHTAHAHADLAVIHRLATSGSVCFRQQFCWSLEIPRCRFQPSLFHALYLNRRGELIGWVITLFMIVSFDCWVGRLTSLRFLLQVIPFLDVNSMGHMQAS